MKQAPTLFVTWPSAKDRDAWQADIPRSVTAIDFRTIWPATLALTPVWPDSLHERLSSGCNLIRAVCASTSGEVSLAWNEAAPALSRSKLTSDVAAFEADGTVPVHSLISFDYAAPQMGIFGAATRNLSCYVGLEIHGHLTDDSQRRQMARMVVRLALDMLTVGPYPVGVHHLPAHGDQIVTALVTETNCHLSFEHSALS